MKPLYTEIDLKNAKSSNLLPCKCYECDKTFYVEKKYIIRYLKNPTNKRYQYKFCNRICMGKQKLSKIKLNCTNCNNEFFKFPNQIKKTKNHFCSSSCSATYNNTHKRHGNRRSKLETWLEEQLTILYPKLEILYNNKEAIKSELDIYVSSLNLAIELNGIFHYEPIHGQNKLDQIQNNDNRKFQACLENKIELCIIDSSNLKYNKPERFQKYLDIIINIINQKL